MKFLYSLGFIALLLLLFWLATWNNNRKFKALADGNPVGGSADTFIALFGLLVAFAQFWLLTGIFNLTLVLILMGLHLAGGVIYLIMGAITGFSLEEKKPKLSILPMIMGTQQPVTGCAVMIISTLMLLLSAAGSLWYFWKYPLFDQNAVLPIALFHFVLLRVVMVPVRILVLGKLVSSEYNDDDFRNSEISANFSFIIFNLINLLFPLWLVEKDVVTRYGITLPPTWIILSVPLVLYMLGAIIPFFIGLFRFRHQKKNMIEWQVDWLSRMQNAYSLPEGDLKQDQINERITELQNEIKKRFSQNKLFHFYQKLRAPNIGDDVRPLPIFESGAPSGMDNVDIHVVKEQLTVGKSSFENTSVHRMDITLERITQIKLMTTRLRGGMSHRDDPNLNSRILKIIEDNQANLIEWDIRFAHLSNLLELLQISIQSAHEDLTQFLALRIDELQSKLKDKSMKKNVIAGSTLTVLSCTSIWLFEKFENDILAFIRDLVARAY